MAENVAAPPDQTFFFASSSAHPRRLWANFSPPAKSSRAQYSGAGVAAFKEGGAVRTPGCHGIHQGA